MTQGGVSAAGDGRSPEPSELASGEAPDQDRRLRRLTRAMRGVITGRDVMQNVGIIYREFGVRCLARCLWVLAIGKRTTFLEMITEV